MALPLFAPSQLDVFELFPLVRFDAPSPSSSKRRKGCLASHQQQQAWPKLDIVEHEKDFVVTVDAPGVPKDKLKIELNKNALALSYNLDETAEEQSEDGAKVLRRERVVESFRRTIRFPRDVGIDKDKISAQMADGVLTLTLPKAPESVPRTIAIE